MNVYHTQKKKNSTFCCPLAILWCNHYYYYQMMMIDWLKEKKRERDNLTPRHLHVYIDDELQKTYPIVYVVISEDDKIELQQ